MSEPRSVSVIGLGLMGSALARTFLANGHGVTVWNRSPEKCEPLRSAGAVVAASLGAALDASPVIVVCVLDYEASDALLHTSEAAAKLKGKVVVQLTTGTSNDARSGEAWSKKNGVTYLDGAILSYPKDVGRPECTILFSGPKGVYEAQAALLSSLGGNCVFISEEIGSASALDSSVLSLYYSTMIGFVHGAAIARSESLPIEAYTATAMALLPILGEMMKSSADLIAKGDYDASQASMTTHAAALGHIARMCRENGVDAAHPQFLKDYCDRAIAAGNGGAEIAAVFELLERGAKKS